MKLDARTLIRARVTRNLGVLSPAKHPTEIHPEHDLTADLKLSRTLRRALAPGFQKIVRHWNHTGRFTMEECDQLSTVQECLEMIHEKAGYPENA